MSETDGEITRLLVAWREWRTARRWLEQVLSGEVPGSVP